MGFKIIGTGKALPKRIITNDQLSEIMDTSDEWISSRTGIKSRHILSDDESLLDLGTQAAKSALKKAEMDAAEIDLLIVSTVGGDNKTPSLSCLIAGRLDIDCITFDINMACCGFVYALNAAYAYLDSGMAKNCLIVSAEALSRLADWTDRSTCVLFGDGVGAVLLTADKNKCFFDLTVNGGEGWQSLYASRTTNNCPYNTYEDKGYLHMNGQEIYKFAVSSITARINGVLEKAGMTTDDINAVLLHQANLRIIKSAVSRLKINEDKIPHNIEHYGNTSSATLPILLDEYSEKLRRGDKIIFCAFGAGLSSAACLLEW